VPYVLFSDCSMEARASGTSPDEADNQALKTIGQAVLRLVVKSHPVLQPSSKPRASPDPIKPPPLESAEPRSRDGASTPPRPGHSPQANGHAIDSPKEFLVDLQALLHELKLAEYVADLATVGVISLATLRVIAGQDPRRLLEAGLPRASAKRLIAASQQVTSKGYPKGAALDVDKVELDEGTPVRSSLPTEADSPLFQRAQNLLHEARMAASAAAAQSIRKSSRSPSPQARKPSGRLDWEEFANPQGYVYFFHHPSKTSHWSLPSKDTPCLRLDAKQRQPPALRTVRVPKPSRTPSPSRPAPAQQVEWRAAWEEIGVLSTPPLKDPSAMVRRTVEPRPPSDAGAIVSETRSVLNRAREASARSKSSPRSSPRESWRVRSNPSSAESSPKGVRPRPAHSPRSYIPQRLQARARKTPSRPTVRTGREHDMSSADTSRDTSRPSTPGAEEHPPPATRTSSPSRRLDLSDTPHEERTLVTDSTQRARDLVSQADIDAMRELYPQLDAETARRLAQSACVASTRVMGYANKRPDLAAWTPVRASKESSDTTAEFSHAPKADARFTATLRPGLYRTTSESTMGTPATPTGGPMRVSTGTGPSVPSSSTASYAYKHAATLSQSSGAGNVYDRLTDPRGFTGTHRHRFDRSGRGLGLRGRDSADVDYEWVREHSLLQGGAPVFTTNDPGSVAFGVRH
jgi:hypothetical protein